MTPHPSARQEAEQLARQFHESYEKHALFYGYQTRIETRQFDPMTPNGMTMIAVMEDVMLPALLAAKQRGREATYHQDYLDGLFAYASVGTTGTTLKHAQEEAKQTRGGDMSEKPTLKAWILAQAEGESIEGVVIGEMGWGDYGYEGVPNYEACPKNVVLSWDTAQPWLSYEFDSGYGAPGCQAITAWTKSWVIGISQYHGSTGSFRLPRNPVDHKPDMPGH